MFLSFSVTGASVRPFVQLLQTASRQGSELFFEPRADVLRLRAVNNSRSTHFLVSIAASYLEGYRCAAGTESPEYGNSVSQNKAKHSVVENEESSNDFHLLLITKALTATVLRQTPTSLSAMHIRFDVASAAEIGSRDTLQWECVHTSGIVKKYALPLADGQPERAYVSPECFNFEACATAKIWASLLASFPASTPRVVVEPLDGRLALWAVDDAGADPSMAPHDSTKSGGVGTTVFISEENFNFMRYRAPAEAQEEPRGELGEKGKTGTTALPGKIIEMKPFKRVCYLADHLGLNLCVRSGGADVPLFIETIAPQDPRLAIPASVSNGSAAFPTFALPVQTETTWHVSFCLYIAALDAPVRAIDGRAERLSGGRRLSTNATNVPMTLSTTAATATAGAITRNASVAPVAGSMNPTPMNMEVPVVSAGLSTTPSAAGFTIPNGAVSSSNISCSEPLGALNGNLSLSQIPSRHNGPHNSSVVEPSRISVKTTEASPGGIVMPPTPYSQENRTSEWSPYLNKRSREDCAIERSNGSSPTERKVCGTMGTAGDMVSFVAPTTLSENEAASRQMGSPHYTSEAVQADSLASQYQLDFGVFMRELEEEKEAEVDEEGEELQRFLEDCASMLVLPATQNLSGPS